MPVLESMPVRGLYTILESKLFLATELNFKSIPVSAKADTFAEKYNSADLIAPVVPGGPVGPVRPVAPVADNTMLPAYKSIELLKNSLTDLELSSCANNVSPLLNSAVLDISEVVLIYVCSIRVPLVK